MRIGFRRGTQAVQRRGLHELGAGPDRRDGLRGHRAKAAAVDQAAPVDRPVPTPNEPERQAWVRGYRAALDDLATFGRTRLAEAWEGVIADLRADLKDIDDAGKRKAALARLRQHAERTLR